MPGNSHLTSTSARSPLSPIKRVRTTTDEVEERLILAIAMGERRPGERVTEAEIAQALDVSRVPVREAMQKLLLRGILTEGGHRGLHVLDYSTERVAEVFELRLMIEGIILRRVMMLKDRSKLIGALEEIVKKMATLTRPGDPVALSSVDLEFHRTVAQFSGHKLAAQIWEGLAQHLLIVFCQHWSGANNRAGEVKLHEEMIEYIRNGSIDDLDAILADHFARPDMRQSRDM